MVDKRDIQQLNRLYLLVAQRLASQDVEFAAQVTGFSKQILAQIAELSLSQIDELQEEVSFLLFKPRLNESGFMKMLSMPSGVRGSFMSSALANTVEGQHEAT